MTQDRAALIEMMTALGVAVRQYKARLAWLSEKAARLKLNGRMAARSPLSLLEELELMRLGVEGKAAGWRSSTSTQIGQVFRQTSAPIHSSAASSSSRPPASAGLRITEIASFVAVPASLPSEGEPLPDRPDQGQALRRLRCSPGGAARKPGPRVISVSARRTSGMTSRTAGVEHRVAARRQGEPAGARGEPPGNLPATLADSEPAGFNGRPIRCPAPRGQPHMFVVARPREPGSAPPARPVPGGQQRPPAGTEHEQVAEPVHHSDPWRLSACG